MNLTYIEMLLRNKVATQLGWVYVLEMDICSLRRLPVCWGIKQHKDMGR